MLTYTQILKRSLKTVGATLAVDAVIAASSTLFGFSPSDVFGNLLLLETAALFIIAGILDFGSSAGIAQLRKIILPSKEGFSLVKRKENERSALVFVAAGVILMSIMILIAAFDLSVLRP